MYFKQRIQNQKGSLVAHAMVVSGVMVAGMMGLMTVSKRNIESSSRQIANSDFHLATQKALVVGSYLITNNLILCREQGWRNRDSGMSQGTLCRWGGGFHNPVIDFRQFGILRLGYSDDKLYTDFELSPGIGTRIYFRLMQWEESNNYSSLIGSLSPDVLKADGDKYIVVLEAETKYTDSVQLAIQDAGSASSSSGSVAVAPVSVNNESYRKVAGIRRPLGVPQMTVYKDPMTGACIPRCNLAVGENPFPECRAAGVIVDGTEQQLVVKVTNLGPGSLYRIAYQKGVNFSSAFFSAAEKARLDSTSKFNIFGPASGTPEMDVMMPGQTVETTERLVCAKPSMVAQTITQQVTGAAAGTATSTAISLHYQKFSSYRFDLTADASINVIPASQSISATTTYSEIEPRKLGANVIPPEIEVNRELANVTTVITQTIPQVVEVVPTGDGGGGSGDGGDGGGGGDGN